MAGLSTAAPRPLQLAGSPLESLPSSQPDLAIPDGSPHSAPLETIVQAWNHHVTTPNTTTVAALKRQSARNPRRHSSISYIHSDSNSLSRSFRRESVDGFNRSPISPSHKVTAFDIRQAGQRASSATRVDFQFGLSRSRSVAGVKKNEAKSLKSSAPDGPRTESDHLDLNVMEGVKHLKERHPVTLAEKHAELLQFIAQKEAKCLELKTQLATHEAELLQLKHRWELIVNRGLEKSHGLSSPTLSPQYLSPSHGLVSKSYLTSPQLPSYFPLSPPMVNAHAPVLEGIKEGVQGVGRLIAAGLESIAGGPVDISFSSPGSESLPSQPLVLNPASKPASKALKLGHGQNESQSSSSTSASVFSTFSTTDTSVTSIASSEEGKTISPTAESTSLSVGEAEYHDEEPSIESTTSDISEQVLFVRDTGTTPTMSPNPEFEQKRQRNEKRKGRLSGSSVVKSKMQRDGIALIEDDNWHNWDAVPSTSYAAEKPYLNDEIGGLKAATPTTTASSSNLSLGVTGPTTPQHLNSWMGSVGKRWGEIKGSSASTFVKNQKRASLLLSDMQNSFVTALMSPPPFAPSSSVSSNNSSKSSEKQPASSFASNTSSFTLSPQYHHESKREQLPKPVTPSLLDSSDTEEDGDAEAPGKGDHATIRLKTPLVPSSRAAPMSVSSSNTAGFDMGTDKMEKGQSLEDEWNWM